LLCSYLFDDNDALPGFRAYKHPDELPAAFLGGKFQWGAPAGLHYCFIPLLSVYVVIIAYPAGPRKHKINPPLLFMVLLRRNSRFHKSACKTALSFMYSVNLSDDFLTVLVCYCQNDHPVL